MAHFSGLNHAACFGPRAVSGQPPKAPAQAIPEFLPAGETYTVEGGTIKAGLISKEGIGFMGGDKGLCTMIEVTNSSQDTWSVNPFEFRIIYPDNTRDGVAFSTDRNLNHTELLPGDTVAGKVCFNDLGLKGEHKIVYQPFFANQLRWIANID